MRFLWPILVWIPLLLAADVTPVNRVAITGGDEAQVADVSLENGKKRLAVDATVSVEEIFGKDPNGTSFFFFGDTLEDADGIGAADDTVRVQIPAAVSPLDTVYPAVDVTYTIVSGDVSASNPEREVALNVCAALKADSNFQTAMWDCSVAKDFAYVHIASKLVNEFGERTSWTVTCSGTTTCNEAFVDIARRGKETELSRSPNDPGRLGILSIAGTVTTLPGGIGDQFQEKFVDGGSPSLLVDGSVTPVIFDVTADSSGATAKRRFVTFIRCYGGGNGIKFGQMLSRNTSLANGIEIKITSQGEVFTFLPIKSTEDWKNYFSTDPGDFRIDVQSGADQFLAQFEPPRPIPLIENSSDKAEVKVQDDLTSGITQLECLIQGFEREV